MPSTGRSGSHAVTLRWKPEGDYIWLDAVSCFAESHLLKNSHDPCQHIVNKLLRQGLHLAAVAGMKVKYTWLIASDDASCFEAVKRDGKADPSREIATVCDWKYHWQLRCIIEGIR